jgi:ubiquinone/menaquinone biosynthesis C-methylase UbiE
MGLWREWVFPRFMDFTARDNEEIKSLRSRALARADGRILELGFGTGLNLPHYPPQVRRIVAVDPNPGMATLARRRMATLPIEVEHHQITAEELPFASASFESVVCTLTLCSIPRVESALREVRRVLKPGGQFLFFEHGRHPDPAVSKWQDRLNGIWGKVFDGCHINRDMRALVAQSGLALTQLENPVMTAVPRPVGYCYLGRAERPPDTSLNVRA